jgi:predicted MPP superfamily phosphohydrolase
MRGATDFVQENKMGDISEFGGAGQPSGMEDISRRIGPELLARRVAKQAAHWARLLHQGEGVLKIERLVPVDALLSALLKFTGLYARAHANFLAVRVVEQVWNLPNLPRAFDGFRLLQLTDLHLDLDLSLGDVVEKLVCSTPHDAAVITGDFRNLTDSDFTSAIQATEKIVQLLAYDRFGILGNHDFIEKVAELESVGLPILLNEATPIWRDGSEIWICGIDDPHFYRTHDLQKVAAIPPSGAFRILLSHSPEVADEAAGLGFDLMLSGHTHGGQICLPGGHALVVPVRKLDRDLLVGRWRRKDMLGYTSPGTGSCGVAARFNCQPEITLHVLRRPGE